MGMDQVLRRLYQAVSTDQGRSLSPFLEKSSLFRRKLNGRPRAVGDRDGHTSRSSRFYDRVRKLIPQKSQNLWRGTYKRNIGWG